MVASKPQCRVKQWCLKRFDCWRRESKLYKKCVNYQMWWCNSTRQLLSNADSLICYLSEIFSGTRLLTWQIGMRGRLYFWIWIFPIIFSGKVELIATRTSFANCCCFWQLTMNIYQKLKWYEIERHAFLAPIILQNESCALHRVASKTVHKSRVNPRRGQKGLLEGAQTFIHPSTKRKTL